MCDSVSAVDHSPRQRPFPHLSGCPGGSQRQDSLMQKIQFLIKENMDSLSCTGSKWLRHKNLMVSLFNLRPQLTVWQQLYSMHPLDFRDTEWRHCAGFKLGGKFKNRLKLNKRRSENVHFPTQQNTNLILSTANKSGLKCVSSSWQKLQWSCSFGDLFRPP